MDESFVEITHNYRNWAVAISFSIVYVSVLSWFLGVSGDSIKDSVRNWVVDRSGNNWRESAVHNFNRFFGESFFSGKFVFRSLLTVCFLYFLFSIFVLVLSNFSFSFHLSFGWSLSLNPYNLNFYNYFLLFTFPLGFLSLVKSKILLDAFGSLPSAIPLKGFWFFLLDLFLTISLIYFFSTFFIGRQIFYQAGFLGTLLGMSFSSIFVFPVLFISFWIWNLIAVYFLRDVCRYLVRLLGVFNSEKIFRIYFFCVLAFILPFMTGFAIFIDVHPKSHVKAGYYYTCLAGFGAVCHVIQDERRLFSSYKGYYGDHIDPRVYRFADCWQADNAYVRYAHDCGGGRFAFFFYRYE